METWVVCLFVYLFIYFNSMVAEPEGLLHADVRPRDTHFAGMDLIWKHLN